MSRNKTEERFKIPKKSSKRQEFNLKILVEENDGSETRGNKVSSPTISQVDSTYNLMKMNNSKSQILTQEPSTDFLSKTGKDKRPHFVPPNRKS